MKKFLNILMVFALIAILGGCSKENPFQKDFGTLRTAGIKVSIINDDDNTKAESNVNINDFTVQIIEVGASEPYRSYRYADMPEVVDLPVGTYNAVAFYGENPSAGWNAPYYRGETESSFRIIENQITEVADPIVCKFANIKVTVFFDDTLSAVMSPDSKVTVQAGDSGSLEFTKDMEGVSGYFAYVNDSQTLVATFSGMVEDYPTVESKTYADVAAGKHYKITFKLHTPDPGKGDSDMDLKVDATVITEDLNFGIDPDDDLLEDDMRPKEEDPDDKGDQEDKGPEITAEKPVNLDGVNELTGEGLNCVLNITSKTGITEFFVDIESDKLTQEELKGIGLDSHLDLINPGECKEGLSGLGFPIENEVKGSKKVKIDISGFMSMLAMLGSDCNHVFVLKVTDANGTTTKSLRIHVK